MLTLKPLHYTYTYVEVFVCKCLLYIRLLFIAYVFDVSGRRVRTRITVHVADSIIVRVAFARLAFRGRRCLGDPFSENLQKLFHQVQVFGIHFFRREQ